MLSTLNPALEAELLSQLCQLTFCSFSLLFCLCSKFALTLLEAYDVPLLSFHRSLESIFYVLLCLHRLAIHTQRSPARSHTQHPCLQHGMRYTRPLKGDTMITSKLDSHKAGLGLWCRLGAP